MTVAKCISVPFVMPEGPDQLGLVSCFIEEDTDGTLLMVTEGYAEPIIGSYRVVASGMLILVTQTNGGSLCLDVCSPTTNKLVYAGIMKKTPAQRFQVCTPGKKWYYERQARERLTDEGLKEILIKFGGKLPLALDADAMTEVPEAVIGM